MCGIYKIENLINGKIYIGQSVNIQYRFANHKSESFNEKSNAYDTALHRAIRKYGVENFAFDVVEECQQDALQEREIYWIKYYNSFGNGYNMTSGGEGVPAIDVERVRQLWDKGMSIDDISAEINCNKHTAIRVLESYPSYNNEESYRRGRINSIKKQCKPICQYDKDGNLIKKYNSVTEAANETHIRRNNISAALIGRQLSAGGYQWTYYDNDVPSVYNAQSTNEKKPVLQFDLQGNFIAEYDSMSEAANAVGLMSVKSISNCCAGKSHTAAQYKWQLKFENVE